MSVPAFHEIRLLPPVRREIERWVLGSPARELCGILCGTIEAGVARATSIFPLENRARHAHSFAIDARALRQTLDGLERAEEHPLAVGHTHVCDSAKPSFRDLEIPRVTGLAVLIFAWTRQRIVSGGYGFHRRVYPIRVLAE